MRFASLVTVILFALSAPLHAAPAAPLAPMGFLAGHCWKGEIPMTLSSDEHCFAWVLDGHALRDTHTVRTSGKPDVVGETTYYWNPVSKAVEYMYLDSGGTYARGAMESAANALYFPPNEQLAHGPANSYRVRWNPLGEDSIQAFTESRGKDGAWFSVFQMTLKRTK